MNNDIDAQFLCKDCIRYNLCEYYHKRKEDSYICKYFHLSETHRMTNGEVIKAVFPNLKYNRGDGFTMIEADNHATRILIWDSFWDSPYKGVSE